MQSLNENISTLISAEEISHRILQLAQEIDKDFEGKNIVIVGILNGTILFLADLIRRIRTPLKIDFVGVSSYRENTVSGNLVWTKQLTESTKNQHVIVVEDILETGQTLHYVLNHIRESAPKTLKTCVLLDKKVNRDYTIHPDYTGFEIEDTFVVGYGLDYDGSYRNLPYIGVLNISSDLKEIDQGGISASPIESKVPSENIKVVVKYWSFYQSLTGKSSEEYALPVGATIEDLMGQLVSQWAALEDHRSSMLIAIGNNYCRSSQKLNDMDQVSLFPPVQGG